MADRELDDLRAELKEKTREIERLRAELESENQTVNTLTRKLKYLRDERVEACREKSMDQILWIINEWASNKGLWEQIRETGESVNGLARKVDDNWAIARANYTALQNQVITLEKSTREAQQIEASRHEALRQRVEKIEQVVPPGSGSLQTIVEKLSMMGTLIGQRIREHGVLDNRVVMAERKIAALEESENALIDELEGKTDRNTQDINARISRLDQKVSAISSDEASLTKGLANATSLLNDLKSRAYHNTVDLQSLSVRITNLEAKQ